MIAVSVSTTASTICVHSQISCTLLIIFYILLFCNRYKCIHVVFFVEKLSIAMYYFSDVYLCGISSFLIPVMQSVKETWSDNRLSVPVYPDEDYNVPYNSPAANLSGQQALDLAFRGNKVPQSHPSFLLSKVVSK